ncbi:MAG: hypothetical protein HN921_14805 [Bacteroidetes bacterium]|nr:hypothetical protein [Bacteroidota bacterium]MBT3421945.1 hypothetical protein [Bacteroidota bacterium]MBT3933709.1 hypothetical protein [Bacteroidota bacterium]MBT4729119.1 hypothetical protein [Bacteroidota bacterium]MBT4968364.1 hypothetical protein [Bacteroidota bacterium]
MRYIKTILILVVFSFSFNTLFSQEWTIEDPDIVNPNAFNQETIDLGSDLYEANCKSCHGDPEKNNGNALLVPLPPDMASEILQKNSDAELFYKINNGNKLLMPFFSTSLGEEKIWQVVSFIRSFNPDYVPADFVEAEKTELALGQKAVIRIVIQDKEEKIYANALITEKGLDDVPIVNTELKFYVKRYFGNMEIGKAKTNDKGQAVIDFPINIPGDSTGCVDLIVMMSDNPEQVNAVVENAQICSPNIPINIFEKRVMWSENSRTQWWALLSYGFIVVGVWLTILYVVFQIIQVKKLSKL